jgi:hypothetical protein
MERRFVRPLRWVIGPALLLAALGCQSPIEDAAETELVLEPREAVEWPGGPTTLRLVLQLEADHFRVVSATPKRGSVREPSVAENRDDLLAGHSRLVEYAALDVTGTLLSRGLILVPLTAVAEFQDLNVATRVRRREEPLTDPVVKVSIPYSRLIATVAFQGLEPDPEVDPRKWERVPMGQVAVEQRDEDPQSEEKQDEQIE